MLIVVSVIDIIPSIACGVSGLKTKHNGGDISVTNLTERENTLTSLEARCGNPRAGNGGFQGAVENVAAAIEIIVGELTPKGKHCCFIVSPSIQN
jgi:hypothetical protein